ncbi:MAG: ATP-binding protein [Phormidesmis sp.]
MEDFGNVLRRKADEITDIWIRDVQRNIASSPTTSITYEAVRHRLPRILDAIATCLSSSNSAALDSSISTQPNASKSINIRVELGFDIDEMLREFGILRTLIVTALKADFGAGDISNTILALLQVDTVLNDIVARAAQRSTEYQLERIEPMHRELIASNQELIRLVQAQKDNAAHLAHELKNPIHAVVSFSAILIKKKKRLSEAPADPQELKLLERINDNGNQLNRLVSNMLEVSRNESQKLSLKIEPIDVSQLVTKVVDSLEVEAIQKNIELRKDCSCAPAQVNIDSLRLQQVIVNLVSNAIRYTNKGSILVRCYGVDNDRWALSVRDTGRGIRAEQQEKIFKPYVRASQASAYAAESSGLGLTIVSKLVELLQGELALVSEPGQGSTFSITLPLDMEQN